MAEQKGKVQDHDEELSDVTGSDADVPAPPPYKKIVQKCFHRKFTSKGQKKRATIFYEYDREKNVLRYGAVIVPLDRTNKKKTITDFENSAKKRFKRHPVVVQNFKDEGTMKDMQDRIRALLHSHGCKSK